MQFKENAGVYTQNNKKVGEIGRVVVDPRDGSVTALVIRKGLLFPKEKVIPVDMVQSTNNHVVLDKTEADLNDLPDFEEVRYVTPDINEITRIGYGDDLARPYYLYPPYNDGPRGYAEGYDIPRNKSYTERNIPPGTVSLKAGTNVFSADEKNVGTVERIITRPNSQQVTHMLISHGALANSKKLVPAEWIRSVKEDRVNLAVGNRMIDSLPDYQE